MKKTPVANSEESVLGEIVGNSEKINKPIFVEDFGNFNKMPTPYKKIMEKEKFINSLRNIIEFNFTVEYRQVQNLYSKEFWNGLTSVKIFWQYNCGYAICINPNTEEIEVYRIGCEHKNTVEGKISKDYYKVMCKDCGFEYEYDCS